MIKKIFIIFCLITIISSTFVFAENNSPNLTAKSALLIDTKTGKILYSKNENQKMYPASTTKILTAILTLENCNLDDIVTVKHDMTQSIPYGYTTVELQIDEQFTVEQLLQILMVHSANDVANLLAEYIGGSVEGFSTMMNEKLIELGITNTHFTNPSGIHDDNHYTTAKDLATIMEYCIKNKDFIKFSSLTSCNIPATNKHSARIYESTNKLIVPNNANYYSYLVCGKTGYTTESGECLVSYASKDNLNLLCVILGGEVIDGVSTRFEETKKLYEYGYNNYSIQPIFNVNDYITQIQVKNGSISTKNLDLLANNSVSTLLSNSESKENFECIINIEPEIIAPIKKGDILGTATYVIDGEEYTTDLIASHDVEKSYLLYYMIEILIGIILIIVVIFILSHNSKNKTVDV